MHNLAGKLVRLAHARPEFRGSLEPVLRKIAAMRREALRKKRLKKMMETGATFGVISAYQEGSKKQNQERHGQLMRDLQKAGYRPIPLRGSWEGVTEKSVLVPRIDPKVLFELGRKYQQDAVIHKSKDGVLGMYHTKGEPRAEMAVDPKGDPAFEVETDKSLYSKARGLSFEFGFLWGDEVPWDGKKPISRDKMKEFVQEHFPAKADSANGKSRTKFEQTVKGRKFPHPETGNKVLYPSLPSQEQTKLFQQWAA